MSHCKRSVCFLLFVFSLTIVPFQRITFSSFPIFLSSSSSPSFHLISLSQHSSSRLILASDDQSQAAIRFPARTQSIFPISFSLSSFAFLFTDPRHFSFFFSLRFSRCFFSGHYLLFLCHISLYFPYVLSRLFIRSHVIFLHASIFPHFLFFRLLITLFSIPFAIFALVSICQRDINADDI